MKLKTKLFKPNTVICIAMDFKKNRVYAVNVTTRKFYSHPQNVKVNTDLYVVIGIVFTIIIRRFSDQLRAQLYLSTASQNFKILLIGIGILIGFPAFYLGLSRKKRYIFHLDEYLEQHPQSEEVTDVNKAIEKALFTAGSTLAFILGGGIGSAIMFNRFLNDSNLSTYFWAVVLFVIFSLLIVGIRDVLLIFGLESEKQTKNE